jgi:hypothetical protein
MTSEDEIQTQTLTRPSYIYNPKLLDNTSPHSTKSHFRTINSHYPAPPQTPNTSEKLGKEHEDTFLIYANQPLISPHNHKQTQPQVKTTMKSNSNKVKLPHTHPTPQYHNSSKRPRPNCVNRKYVNAQRHTIKP